MTMASFLLLLAQLPPLVYPINPEKSAREEKTLAHPAPILFAMKNGQVAQSVALYHQYVETLGRHDFELVQKMGLILLAQGSRSNDAEEQLLAIFGAGITADPQFLYTFERGLEQTASPQIQLACVHFLSTLFEDRADLVLKKAMASPYPLIRLEAAYALAKKKDPAAYGQIEALMYKLQTEARPLFPTLFAIEGSRHSLAMLRQLLTDVNREVRLEAILNAAQYERDDLVPQIRLLASHIDAPQQEACAWALGVLKDEASAPWLEEMTRAPSLYVRLAASSALYTLGRPEQRKFLEEAALAEKDLFAINLLGDKEGSEETLATLLPSSDPQVRINAALALLLRRDPRCLSEVKKILLRDHRDLALKLQSSPGGALKAWKIIPSSSQQFQNQPMAQAQAMAYREAILQKTLDLPPDTFLEIAKAIFHSGQRELIPLLVELLSNARTPEAISELQQGADKAGAPLTRGYCNLALYRLREEGPYAKQLVDWIKEQNKVDLIRFRPLMPWKDQISSPTHPYQLTPEEQSRLLIDTLTALANQKDPEAIDVLLNTMAHGNPKNRYALAGLLVRATE